MFPQILRELPSGHQGAAKPRMTGMILRGMRSTLVYQGEEEKSGQPWWGCGPWKFCQQRAQGPRGKAKADHLNQVLPSSLSAIWTPCPKHTQTKLPVCCPRPHPPAVPHRVPAKTDLANLILVLIPLGSTEISANLRNSFALRS